MTAAVVMAHSSRFLRVGDMGPLADLSDFCALSDHAVGQEAVISVFHSLLLGDMAFYTVAGCMVAVVMLGLCSGFVICTVTAVRPSLRCSTSLANARGLHTCWNNSVMLCAQLEHVDGGWTASQ
jgi:hypothetical protein